MPQKLPQTEPVPSSPSAIGQTQRNDCNTGRLLSKCHFRGLGLLVLVLLFGSAIKTLVIARSVCISRDGVDYIQFAIYLQRESWTTVLRESPRHPLYPMAIAACQQLLFAGRESEAEAWELAAQLVNWFASLVATPAIFLLARSLIGCKGAFAIAGLFHALPDLAYGLSDALSEGLYLTGLLWSLTFLSFGLNRKNTLWFAAAGLACGLAYLTRPEAALLVGVTVVCLPLLYVTRCWSASAKQLAWAVVAFLLAGLLTILPYIYAIGGLTVKPSARRLLNTGVSVSGPMFAATWHAPQFATHIHHPENLGLLRALYYVAEDTAQAFSYLPLVFVIPGSFLAMWRVRRNAAWLLIVCYSLTYLLVLWRAATLLAYMEKRYTYPITVCGLICAGLAWRYCTAAWSKYGYRWCSWTGQIRLDFRVVLRGALFAFLAACLVKLIAEPLHSGAAGHRQAGLWLKRQIQGHDNLYDPYGLAAFYSGRIVEHAYRFPQPLGSSMGDWWFVLNRWERDHHVRQKIVSFEAVAKSAQEVFHSTVPGATEVVIYRVPGPVSSLSPLGGRYWPRVR